MLCCVGLARVCPKRSINRSIQFNRFELIRSITKHHAHTGQGFTHTYITMAEMKAIHLAVLQGEEAAVVHWFHVDPESLEAGIEAQMWIVVPFPGGLPYAFNLQGCTPLLHAAISPHTHVLKRLIALGANLGAKSEWGNRFSAVRWACYRGRAENLKALIEAGASITERDQDGCTPLHRAAGCREVECVPVLLAM